jgi:YesN/AraC family two-component response regulator
VLTIIIVQKKQMKTAQKILFEKNAKLVELNINTDSKRLEKYRNSAQTDSMQSELLDKILALMEDTPTICDTEFSVDKLAELVSSNYTYVSQVINSVLKKNFRSLLNEYRIREAQRLLSSPDATKYTLEAIALQVGFKSRSAFREVFKKVTGVCPHFYLKSMQQQCENETPVI